MIAPSTPRSPQSDLSRSATGGGRVVSVSRVINSTPEAIFDILTNPARHRDIDGSNMVRRARGDDQRLTLGSKFAMEMKIGPLPYRITNEVVEFEPNRLIAWRHLGRHRWRYVLVPVDEGTHVTESFDWGPSPVKLLIEAAGYPKRHPDNIARTLERLAVLVEPS